eukprot:scaffold49758_cov24-Cyclotella_meneghiniana.AAC.1
MAIHPPSDDMPLITQEPMIGALLDSERAIAVTDETDTYNIQTRHHNIFGRVGVLRGADSAKLTFNLFGYSKHVPSLRYAQKQNDGDHQLQDKATINRTVTQQLTMERSNK